MHSDSATLCSLHHSSVSTEPLPTRNENFGTVQSVWCPQYAISPSTATTRLVETPPESQRGRPATRCLSAGAAVGAVDDVGADDADDADALRCLTVCCNMFLGLPIKFSRARQPSPHQTARPLAGH